MIHIYLNAPHLEQRRVDAIARRLEQYLPIIHIGEAPKSDLGTMQVAQLHLTEQYLREPYEVIAGEGARISLWDSAGICRYAELEEAEYAVLCSLIALSQWRALHQNPLLRQEDFGHPADVHCLYAVRGAIQDYVLQLDDPTLCSGCFNFYHCLGVDSEILGLRKLLSEIHSERNRRYRQN